MNDFTPITAPNGVQYMTAPHIAAVHAFTTRRGGVSGGIYAFLNLGEHRGDDPEAVRENYRLLCEALGVKTLVFTRQVHGSTVRRVTKADAHELFTPVPYEADGLVTDEPGTALVIFTADCIPILLHDPVRGAVGAVHAGWRGTVADIAGEGVRKMVWEFGCKPENIRAAIGPGIDKCCFETGAEVPEAVRKVLPDGEKYVKSGAKEGKFMVDLKGVNRALLMRAGVPAESIAVSDECTMCLNEKYWSHRFTKGERGSQASVIVL